MKHFFSCFLLSICFQNCFGQEERYRYFTDLSASNNHSLVVELRPPSLQEESCIFSFPKIVPGTYSIYDFGRFIDNFKATDSSERPLVVHRVDTNSWEISGCRKLAKISYRVSDTYHPVSKSNPIFEPAGTDFETDTCYVLNLHGIMGYFRGHTKQPFELNVTHTPAFFGSTSLADRNSSDTQDRYEINSYNEAIDNPIMYTRPDTAHLSIGESDILISVYSPSHQATAHGIALQMDSLLQDQAKYLGGKLPVKNYSFLIYLTDKDGVSGGYGALEHSYSSFYFLIDGKTSTIAQTVRDASSHEFFHIVTPLNIHSEEIANFDFDHPKMSEHLWFYEGSTEYHAHLVQVRYGLINPDQYLAVIKEKMDEALFAFNDSLSFTEMSKACLDTFKDQYVNVYAKGMLINMCLDLELLHLSEGKYGLLDLVNDLSKIYGKEKAFKDVEFIPKIVSLTYPSIKSFFDAYVIGARKLPFQEILAYAGVDYVSAQTKRTVSMGQVSLGYNLNTGKMMVSGTGKMNDFGKKMGYKVGDEIEKINGVVISPLNFMHFKEEWLKNAKEGDWLKVTVKRISASGKLKKTVLKAKLFKADSTSYNSLHFKPSASEEQLKIRKAWLYGKP